MEDDIVDYSNEMPVGIENESDLETLQKADISSVNVTGTDWTTETLLSQMAKGNIELNPRFQRRDAWEKKRKSLFIESLILGLPVPQIVLAERKETRGQYVVLDGKQRLLCLRQFTASPTDPEFTFFKLEGLEIRPDLDGRGFSDLQQDFHFRDDLTAFENQPIRTVVVRNWRSEALLFHVFLRLNRGSKPLSPQELRQALHPGPFLNFADERSGTSRAIREIFNLKEPDFRMRDVELLIRYFSFRRRLPEYRGNLKDFLDSSCAEFNRQWTDLSGVFSTELEEFEEAHLLAKSTFGARFNYGKWISGRFEKRFNRAVFDVIVSVFCQKTFKELILADPQKAEVAFKSLCDNDPRFIDAIERTTKSLEATRYRFQSFYGAFAAEYGCTVPAPIVGK